MKRKGKKICIWVLRYKNCIWIHKLYFVFGYKIQNLGWVPLVVSVWVLFCICILYLRFLYFVFCIFRTQVKKGSEPGFFYFFVIIIIDFTFQGSAVRSILDPSIRLYNYCNRKNRFLYHTF